jgi:hypothetical protein
MSINLEKIQQTGRFQSTAIPEQLVLELKQLDMFNAEVKRKVAFYGRLATGYTLGAVLSGVLFLFGPIFLGFLAPAFLLRLLPFFGFLGVVLTIMAFVFGSIRGRFKGLELAEYRYELAKFVVEILGRDLDKYAMLSLSLSFKPNDRVEHTVPHPRKSGWRIDFFSDVFLQVEGKFLDGTEFVIKFTELMREKKGRNINGKFRVKPVNKGMHISILLRVKGSVYGDLSRFDGAFDSRVTSSKLLRFAQGGILRKLKLKGKVLQLVVALPEASPLRFAPSVFMGGKSQTTLQMGQVKDVQRVFSCALLNSYQILNLARLLEKERRTA